MDSRYIRWASQDTDASGSEVSPEWGWAVGHWVGLSLKWETMAVQKAGVI